MNQSIKSRIAPTPSGLLHLGNAYNFLITYRETVIKRSGELLLRIDDSDSQRIRDEYIQDIFDSISWLEIPISYGPKNMEDFKSKYSQGLKKDHYFKMINKIPDTFVCQCSRSFLKENQCPCKNMNLKYTPGENSIRVEVKNQELFNSVGDFVVWRKDDLPSYQLASLVDDIDNNINLIIRGEDLMSSTKAQFYLAELLNDTVYTHAHFMHHPLIKDKNNDKISKSQNSNEDTSLSLKAWREEGKTKVDLVKHFGFNSWEDFIND